MLPLALVAMVALGARGSQVEPRNDLYSRCAERRVESTIQQLDSILLSQSGHVGRHRATAEPPVAIDALAIQKHCLAVAQTRRAHAGMCGLQIREAEWYPRRAAIAAAVVDGHVETIPRRGRSPLRLGRFPGAQAS